MEVFKSDSPIPNSEEAKNQRFFHIPVAFSFGDADVEEEDPISSDSESGSDFPCNQQIGVQSTPVERLVSLLVLVSTKSPWIITCMLHEYLIEFL